MRSEDSQNCFHLQRGSKNVDRQGEGYGDSEGYNGRQGFGGVLEGKAEKGALRLSQRRRKTKREVEEETVAVVEERRRVAGGGRDKEGDTGGGGDGGKGLANRFEYVVVGSGYGYRDVGSGYVMDLLHAPQFFSDENANGCTIM
ncbi:hypothetical protein Ancab_012887 [Ancistrocladus abbreviatus]